MTTPAGELSLDGKLGDCALEAYEWHVVGAVGNVWYRTTFSYVWDEDALDERLDGEIGPDGTAVEQFRFVFCRESN